MALSLPWTLKTQVLDQARSGESARRQDRLPHPGRPSSRTSASGRCGSATVWPRDIKAPPLEGSWVHRSRAPPEPGWEGGRGGGHLDEHPHPSSLAHPPSRS